MSEYDRRPSNLARFFKVLAFALERWPLLLLLAFIALPQGPHLLLQWDSYGQRSNPHRDENCVYLGSRGLIRPGFYGHDACPYIAWIDTREFRP